MPVLGFDDFIKKRIIQRFIVICDFLPRIHEESESTILSVQFLLSRLTNTKNKTTNKEKCDKLHPME